MIFGDYNRNYPDPKNVVYPQRVPYRGPIPGGLSEGKLIEIRGTAPYGSDIFQVNLLTGLDASSDRALHVSVRFPQRIVVRNSMERGVYGFEERQGLFPFQTGQEFTMMILVEPTSYRIAVNGQHCWEFVHRIPISRVSSIFIDGAVHIERIEFVNKISPYQPGTCQPPGSIYPYGDPTRGHLIPGLPTGTCVPLPGRVPDPYIFPSQTIGTCVPPPERNIVICPPAPVQPSSNLPPVYNPSIPYAYPIYGGLQPGMMIYLSGRPSASANRFTLNFQSGTSPYPPPDISFHFDARFYNRTVVRNSRTNNVYANEELAIPHFPFQQAVNFDMIIRVENDKYMVAINGQHFVEFRHRLFPLSRFDTLSIENDVIISSIRFG
ncbi:LOW QUALITY PROTEIN: galectin-4-like [Uloborus diversus]|uniref:LOW QUALITY PROTEIN: galectin-4-like n=1 Tax=Uloborus diversus TaxID=327109 RepID=UPI0024091247|nr:LOW QUALITY PROTEIN: galectin-4-like [Uloborus diversus]